jgi:phage terminase small subunit
MAGLTPKQEAFALAYVETGNASEAYRRSYNAEKMKPETVNRTAKELLDNPKIAARLAELKAAHVERHEITVDDLIRELEEARSIAMAGERQQPAAMVAASMGKAKLLGLIVDKAENKNDNRTTVLFDAEQVKRMAGALLRGGVQ